MEDKYYLDRLWEETDTVAALDALRDADRAVTIIKKDMFRSVASVSLEIYQDEGVGDTERVGKVKSILQSFEKKYKKERGVKSMPGSYRSAKSVILQALRCHVSILSTDGEVRSKPELEREIKEKKKEQRAKNWVDEHTREAKRHLSYLAPGKVGESKDKRRLSDNLDWIERRVQEIRDLYL